MPAWLETEWRHLALLNYEIDAAAVARKLPSELELDLWEGRAFASVIGHVVQHPRWLGFRFPEPEPFARVGLKIYVKRRVGTVWRRGELWWQEYFPTPPKVPPGIIRRSHSAVNAPTRFSIHFEPKGKISDAVVEYGWQVGAEWAMVSLRSQGIAQPTESWPWEHFLLHRSYSYSADGREGSIEHPIWFFWEVESAALSPIATTTFGPEFAPFLREKPESAIFVKGSKIGFGRLKRF